MDPAQMESREEPPRPTGDVALAHYPHEPEPWLQLAGSYLLIGDRPRALLALSFGLYYTRGHGKIIRMMEELGLRRTPFLPLLDRDNVVNVILGKARQRALGPKRVR